MAKVKTQFTSDDVYAYIDDLDNDQKKKDSLALIELMEEATGEPAKMFGPSIIGFGQYHYKYATGHQGDAPLLGFSPRKAAISLYINLDVLKNIMQESIAFISDKYERILPEK